MEDYQCFDIRLFDPELLVSVIQDCKTTQEIKVVTDYGLCKTNITVAYFDNSSKTNETKIVQRDKRCKLGEHTEYINTTICENIGFMIDGKILKFGEAGWGCKKVNTIITCDAPHQSNKDGICQSGERCAIFDTKDLSSRINKGYSPTKQIEELKIE